MSESNEPAWDDMVLVGIIARPHGLRGQVVVNAETDFPEQRFRPGSRVWIAGRPPAPLVVETVRFQNGRPVIGFAGVDRVEQAETLAGRELRIPEEELQPLEQGVYYHHQLVGCQVVERDGTVVGEVARVEGGLGGSLLVVPRGGSEVLIPLAQEICVGIDVAAKRIDVTLPAGLLELNETRRSRGVAE